MSEDGQIKAQPTFVTKAKHLFCLDNNSNNTLSMGYVSCTKSPGMWLQIAVKFCY